MERPHLLHEVSQLPPHYLPPHLRQMVRMPMMARHPQPGRSSPGGPAGLPPYQYPEIHRTALEKQLAAPSMPPMPRVVLQKPPTPQPIEPIAEKPESREPTPVTDRPEKEENPSSPDKQDTGDDVNKIDEPVKHIKEEIREVHPREEGSVFGGLVSYFSSQREDDIDT